MCFWSPTMQGSQTDNVEALSTKFFSSSSLSSSLVLSSSLSSSLVSSCSVSSVVVLVFLIILPMKSASLMPEFKRAASAFDSALTQLSMKPISEVSSAIWTQGAFSLFDAPVRIRRIPAGRHWRWNQTKGKQGTTVSDGSKLLVVKLVPRKASGAESPAPKYKLWLFQFEDARTGFWCETGGSNPEHELLCDRWTLSSDATVAAPLSERSPSLFNPLPWCWESRQSSRAEAYNLNYICNL